MEQASFTGEDCSHQRPTLQIIQSLFQQKQPNSFVICRFLSSQNLTEFLAAPNYQRHHTSSNNFDLLDDLQKFEEAILTKPGSGGIRHNLVNTIEKRKLEAFSLLSFLL